MDVGNYDDWQAREHNPDINVKTWMQEGARSGWWKIPSIEGVFNKGTGLADPGSASYNYGNNVASHAALDYIPWKVFDVWGY